MEFEQSRAGRQTALVLLLGALAIWVFALWMFGATLGLRLPQLASSLRAVLARQWSVAELVPALLMLVLVVASPLLIWSILVEWRARYVLSDSGLRFSSLGLQLSLPWQEIRAVRVAPAGSEPAAEIISASDPLAAIGNPLRRALYRQALGRGRLPIYGGLERREELISEIERWAARSAVEQ